MERKSVSCENDFFIQSRSANIRYTWQEQETIRYYSEEYKEGF